MARCDEDLLLGRKLPSGRWVGVYLEVNFRANSTSSQPPLNDHGLSSVRLGCEVNFRLDDALIGRAPAFLDRAGAFLRFFVFGGERLLNEGHFRGFLAGFDV
jgi:hypothetical protein